MQPPKEIKPNTFAPLPETSVPPDVAPAKLSETQPLLEPAPPTEQPTESPQETTLPEAPEKTFEMPPPAEPPDIRLPKTADTLRHLFGKIKNPPPIPLVRDALTMQVEKIMEENMTDAYLALDMVKRQEFKLAGERTAYAVRQLLKQAHVKLKKIFKLIFRWLKLLPGINRFYLEQEAKIKADKIVALKKKED